MANARERLGHREVLDGVRGVAIAAVVVGHAAALIVPATRDWVAPAGYLGVDLFFVLSGFLITTLLYDERTATGRLSMGGFYGRRASRLLPALLVLLAVHLAYSVGTGVGLALELKTLGLALGYVFNWAVSEGWELAGGLEYLWSLSVEEQFYVVWPWVVLGLALLSPRRAAAVVVVAMVASAAMRWYVTEAGSVSAYHRTDTRADALLVGALAATLRGQLRPAAIVWLRRAAWIAGPAFVAVVLAPNAVGPAPTVRTDVLFHGGFTLVALAAGVVVLAAVESDWNAHGVLVQRWLVLLGRVSYGLYLWHAFMAYLVIEHLHGLWAPLRLTLWVAATTAATAASWHWIEQPVLRWARGRRSAADLAAEGRVVVSATTAPPVRR